MSTNVNVKGIVVNSQHYAGYLGDRWLHTIVDGIGRVFIWSTTYPIPEEVNYDARVESVRLVGGTEIYKIRNCKKIS